MTTNAGVFIVGTVLGLKGTDRKDRNGNPMIDAHGAPVKEWEVGVSVPVPNGFEGECETISARFSSSQISSGVPALYAKAKGQQVMIPVWVQVWQSKAGKVGHSWWLSGDGKPCALPSAMKAA